MKIIHATTYQEYHGKTTLLVLYIEDRKVYEFITDSAEIIRELYWREDDSDVISIINMFKESEKVNNSELNPELARIKYTWCDDLVVAIKPLLRKERIRKIL